MFSELSLPQPVHQDELKLDNAGYRPGFRQVAWRVFGRSWKGEASQAGVPEERDGGAGRTGRMGEDSEKLSLFLAGVAGHTVVTFPRADPGCWAYPST